MWNRENMYFDPGIASVAIVSKLVIPARVYLVSLRISRFFVILDENHQRNIDFRYLYLWKSFFPFI